MTCEFVKEVRELARKKGLNPKLVGCTTRQQFCIPHEGCVNVQGKIASFAQAHQQIVDPTITEGSVHPKEPIMAFYDQLAKHDHLIHPNGNGRVH